MICERDIPSHILFGSAKVTDITLKSFIPLQSMIGVADGRNGGTHFRRALSRVQTLVTDFCIRNVVHFQASAFVKFAPLWYTLSSCPKVRLSDTKATWLYFALSNRVWENSILKRSWAALLGEPFRRRSGESVQTKKKITKAASQWDALKADRL